VKVLVVVKDDPNVRFLVETIFSMDARFTLAAVVSSAEEARESLRTTQPEIIVLDHGLSGQLTGLDGAATKRAGSASKDHHVHSPHRSQDPRRARARY
jgi:response regulator of citrate/malate metabolism